MAGQTLEFKGWQMGTWFTVDESDIADEEEELKILLKSSSGTKVKVRMDKYGLKVTKTSISFVGSEKIPLQQIKKMYTNPKFPMCFFCTSSRPDGCLLKIIMIRCSNELCAKGIVNYYQNITYKRSATVNSITETTRGNATVTLPTVVVSTSKDENKNETITNGNDTTNGHISMNNNDEETEMVTLPIKKAETYEDLSTAEEAAPDNGIGVDAKEQNIKILSKEVEYIQKQTLKKHPATISRQEYIDAHEKVHRLATELSKQGVRTVEEPPKNSRHYSMVHTQRDRPQSKIPGNMLRIYQPNQQRYLLVNGDGNVVPVVRSRAQTINGGNNRKIQRQERPNSILRSSKENYDIKSSTLPVKPRATPEVIVDSINGSVAPVSDKGNLTTTIPQEPIYAQVNKNRMKDVNVNTNGGANFPTSNPGHGTDNRINVVHTPPVPHRTVTFESWSQDVQRRSSKKSLGPVVRPHSFHQQLHHKPSADMLSLNTHVPKRIENVYFNTFTRNGRLNDQFRPRVNSNTFRDTKQRVAIYTEAF